MGGLRRALETDRPAPTTREDLEAWGGRLADRVESAARLEGGAVPDGIEEALNRMTTETRQNYRLIDTTLVRLRRDIAGLRFRWRAFLAPGIVFVFVLGMAAESSIHALYRLLWAG